MTPDELARRVAELERLVRALAERVATMSEHLSLLAERKEVRGKGDRPGP